MSTEYDIYKQKEMYIAPKDATPTGNPTTLNEVTARYIAERQKEEANNATTQVGDVGEGTITDGSGTTTTTDDKKDGGIVPTTPTTITTPYDKEVEDAQKNLAQWYKDYAKKVAEDEEALKKKQKAARWITAAQMLGDSIAALGNSWATASGANAMALTPGAGKAGEATSQIEQDIRAARDRANKAQMDYAMNRYKMAVDNQKAAMEREQMKQAQANWLKEYNLKLSTENRLEKSADASAQNELARIEIERQKANVALKQAQDKNKPYPMSVNGEIVELPINKINDQIVGSIFAKLPKEVRESAGQPVYGKDDYGETVLKGYKNPSLADMLAAIGTYGNEETTKEIMKLAGVKVEEVEKVEPKEDKREKENTPTNNTELPIQANSAPADEWGSQWRRRAGSDTTDFSQFKRK